MHLLVRPNGSKLWQLRYHFKQKENVLSFGRYPLVTLAKARRKRDDAKALLTKGMDLALQRRLDSMAVDKKTWRTFGLISDEHIERLVTTGAAKTTLDKARWLLQDLAKPLRDRPIREITAAEILGVLKRVETGGRHETARRLRATICTVFRLPISTLRADTDPTQALLPHQVKGRAAITDEGELGALVQAIDEYDGWPTMRDGLKFLTLTCVRPGEVLRARRVELDVDEAVWRIPAKRVKMRRPHGVPLSPQALAVVNEIWPLSEGARLFLISPLQS